MARPRLATRVEIARAGEPGTGTGFQWPITAYVALIVYGSLYPFSGWRNPGGGWLDFLSLSWRGQFHAADTLINVLAYVPLGLLLAHWRRYRHSPLTILTVTIAGAALSFAMEFTQQFLPSRVSSFDDLVTNTAGTLIGAVLAHNLWWNRLPVATFTRWRTRWFAPGRLTDLGLAALVLWALSQTTPFVPSLDLGELRHGLSPLWQTLRHPARFDIAQWAAYALDIGGLALLAQTLTKPHTPIVARFFVAVTGILLYKVPAVARQLSLEAVAGALAAWLMVQPLQWLRKGTTAWAGAALILAGFVVGELRFDPTALTSGFAWVPFDAAMQHPLIGIGAILEALWPATALAYLLRFATTPRMRIPVAVGGGLLLVAIAFGLEWHQRHLPGRVGDITTVLLMAATWWFVWARSTGDSTPD